MASGSNQIIISKLLDEVEKIQGDDQKTIDELSNLIQRLRLKNNDQKEKMKSDYENIIVKKITFKDKGFKLSHNHEGSLFIGEGSDKFTVSIDEVGIKFIDGLGISLIYPSGKIYNIDSDHSVRLLRSIGFSEIKLYNDELEFIVKVNSVQRNL